MGSINWDMFDSKVAICFTGKKERREHLLSETSKVGLHPEIYWSFKTPYDKWEMARLPIRKFIKERTGCYNCSKAHYRAICTAYQLGLNSVLILEDDCRFAKDRTIIENAFANIPTDWDFLMFEHFSPHGRVESINQSWSRVERVCGTSCYAISRFGMSRLIMMYESAVSGKYNRPLLRNCDEWINTKYLGDVKIYAATPNVSIQCKYEDFSNCGVGHTDSKYASMGLSYDDYGEPIQ